jgi:Fructose-1-6-bisphosphatase, N-terminal domain
VHLNDNGKYVVVFDPLDGSRNIECSIPTGTIFGVYTLPEGYQPGAAAVHAEIPHINVPHCYCVQGQKQTMPSLPHCVCALLDSRAVDVGCRAAARLRAACFWVRSFDRDSHLHYHTWMQTMPPCTCTLATSQAVTVTHRYALYSSATMFVATLGGGSAAGFTLDTTIGEFVATHSDLRIPPRGALAAFTRFSLFHSCLALEVASVLRVHLLLQPSMHTMLHACLCRLSYPQLRHYRLLSCAVHRTYCTVHCASTVARVQLYYCSTPGHYSHG